MPDTTTDRATWAATAVSVATLRNAAIVGAVGLATRELFARLVAPLWMGRQVVGFPPVLDVAPIAWESLVGQLLLGLGLAGTLARIVRGDLASPVAPVGRRSRQR